MNELATIENRPLATQDTVLPVQALIARQEAIATVMKTVMKEKVHYGTVPGCKKKSLYLPGAEKLLETFQLAARPSLTEDLSTPDTIRYRVHFEVYNPATGVVLATEAGECSSDEEKYHWRRCYIDEEYKATDPQRRRMKWREGEHKNYEEQQVRTNAADVANTVLAMAGKRAKVRAVRAALAASDIFDVNVEDIPPEYRDMAREEEPDREDAATAHPSVARRARQSGTAAAAREEAGAATVRDIMRLLEQVPGFMEEKDGRNSLTQAAFKFLNKLGAKGKFYDFTPEIRNAVVVALREHIASLTPPATEAAADDYPPVPNITDPFADQ